MFPNKPITMVKKEPVQNWEKHSGHGDFSPNQNALLPPAKILVQHTAFIGHSFDDNDTEIVNFFKLLLSEMSFKCLSGEKAAVQAVSEKVKERIKQREIFVGNIT